MIVVTGASGHIGNVLTRKLLERGYKVRALTSSKSEPVSLKGTGAEVFRCDILDKKSLKIALAGAEAVFHLAGLVNIEAGKEKILEKINLKGTKNIIAACVKNKIPKIVYASSIQIFPSNQSISKISENALIEVKKLARGYARSKALATLEILKAAKNKKIEAVVICPTCVVGPYDFKISPTGQVFLEFAKSRIRPYVAGAYDFVDVRDVTEAMIAALEKGKNGEIYILSGQKKQVKEIYDYLEKYTGNKPIQIKIPSWLISAAAPISYAYCRFTSQKPILTKDTIDILASNSDISHEKASRELGLNPRSPEESVRDAISWFKENNYLFTKQ